MRLFFFVLGKMARDFRVSTNNLPIQILKLLLLLNYIWNSN